MKIAGVTLCFNESKMIKYVMPYWERIGIDKLIVYDNMSTDNTVEMLQQYPFVEVRTFDTNGKFCDATNSKIKTTACQELRDAGYDWVYAGDFDEVIWCPNPNFREELKKIEDMGGDLYNRDLVHPFSIEPIVFDETKLIHEQMTHFLTWHDYTHKWGGSKMLLHNGKTIDKIGFAHGAHSCSVTHKRRNPAYLFGYPFISFHLKFVDFAVLEENSHDKHDRIQWRIFEPNCSEPTRKHLMRHYKETQGENGIKNKITRLLSKCERIGIYHWDEFIKYYNENYLVDVQKFKNDASIKQLDYSGICIN